ncbi:palmitoyltransferase ZDHHC13 isoform X2 [Brachyhypopomus gauderio]|uniref:palmitoyltransferase ZDHHC13 isoform X2 n=1 Tax=Brachyhypopomus gauderio TaxID=698409 RepID=UPI00404357B4
MTPDAAAARNGIFEAVQRGDIEQVVQLLHHDRTLLKQRGWCGFTPLHFAALHGNRPVADLLLNNGADPNVPCDAGQTAFHFACSVAMQYLAETKMFRFSDTDNFLITPLHLAASTGNADVARYLLRENRCAVDAVDHQGATALHVAAEKGMVEVCWLLLQSAGFHILHVKNHNGLTPLDLCSHGTTFRHQQLTRILTQFINKPKDQKPRESYVIYYWTLVLPSLVGAVVLLIATSLGEYGGLFCGLVFPCVAKVILSQYHRMSGYQRLPNPVYLGTLVAGIMHSLVCFYCKILPSIWPAHALLQVSVFHFSLILLLFWKVLKQDPGRLKVSDSDPRFSTIADLVESKQNPNRFCIYCELFQVDKCKHCRLCDFCVMDYDHHCLFLNRCVGRHNHRAFVLFILAMLVGHLLFIGTSGHYLSWRLATEERAGWMSAAGREVWVLLLLLLNVLTLLWEVWLLSEQVEAISSGTTTYFRQCRCKELSWKKRLATFLTFLFEGRSRQDQQHNYVVI